MNKNLWLLILSQVFAFTAAPVTVFLSGIIGSQFSPIKSLATLPMALSIVGIAIFAIFAAKVMSIIGRRAGFILASVGSSLSSLLAAYSIINESFNANPNSMEAAIVSFSNLNSDSCSRKVLLIGDMMELGKFSKNYHKKIAQLINNTSIDIVYAVGEEIRYLWEEIDFQKKGTLFQNVDQVILNLQDLFDNNDTVMLKASSKINFTKIIEEINAQKPIRKIA